MARSIRPRGSVWQALKKATLVKCGGKCVKCGSRDRLELDHIKPLNFGGNNLPNNLQILCNSCHKLKTKSEGHGNRVGRVSRSYPNNPLREWKNQRFMEV